MTPSERFKTVPRGARRDAIERGWWAFKMNGWRAEPAFHTSDDRHWFWLNGLEYADKDRTGCNVDKREIPGWR